MKLLLSSWFLSALASVAAAVELSIDGGRFVWSVESEEGLAYQLEQSGDLRNWQEIGAAFRGDGSLFRIDGELSDQAGEGVFYRAASRPVWSPSSINIDLIKRLSEYDGPDEQLEVVENGDALTIYVSHSEVQGGQLLDGTVKAVVYWETGGNDLNQATFTLEILEVEIRSPIEGRFTIPELVEVYGSSPPVKLVADLSYTGPESGTYEISYYEYGGRRLEYFEGKIEDLLNEGGSGGFF